MKTDQRRIDPAAQRVFDIMQPRVTAEELQRIRAPISSLRMPF